MRDRRPPQPYTMVNAKATHEAEKSPLFSGNIHAADMPTHASATNSKKAKGLAEHLQALDFFYLYL